VLELTQQGTKILVNAGAQPANRAMGTAYVCDFFAWPRTVVSLMCIVMDLAVTYRVMYGIRRPMHWCWRCALVVMTGMCVTILHTHQLIDAGISCAGPHVNLIIVQVLALRGIPHTDKPGVIKTVWMVQIILVVLLALPAITAWMASKSAARRERYYTVHTAIDKFLVDYAAKVEKLS
jgi:hypothetical protein